MGKTYIGPDVCPAFDSYECDNCGEGTLVLAGVHPAGWQEGFKFLNLANKELGWRCPECKSH